MDVKTSPKGDVEAEAEETDQKSALARMRAELDRMLARVSAKEPVNQLWLESKEAKALPHVGLEYFGPLSPWEKETRCDITFDHLRAVIGRAAGQCAEWRPCKPTDPVACAVQIVFNGGAHYCTVAGGVLYHSWWRKFALRAEALPQAFSSADDLVRHLRERCELDADEVCVEGLVLTPVKRFL